MSVTFYRVDETYILRRPSDQRLFLAAAIFFALVVLAGYFKSYYFSAFFEVPSVANMPVHAHAIMMTLWVAYFSAQTALIRTKNVRLHMTIGLVSIVLTVLVVVGTTTAYDAQLVRGTTTPLVVRSPRLIPALRVSLPLRRESHIIECLRRMLRRVIRVTAIHKQLAARRQGERQDG